ncbi:MAG: hypothetical protein RBT05_08285 [Bacteroidales bacterium]|jgi:hypothetical protein|nr:hypothetical protein [Bacteroidales bacterium]
MAEKEYQPVTYLEIGFDKYGMSTIQSAQQIPANLADYILEIAEGSVSNKKIKSVSADKVTAGTLSAVTNVGDDSIVLDGENKTIKIYDDSGNVSVYMKGGSA